MTAFHLTAEAAAVAAAAAYREGNLGFQRGHTSCHYRYGDGSKCALGAALPDEVVAGFDGEFIDALIDDGAVSTDETSALVRLQDAHDRVCGTQLSGGGGVNHRSFLAAVNKHLPATVAPITAADWPACPAAWLEGAA